MKVYGYVYLIVDHWNNHVYVGQKKGLSEKTEDYFGSGKIISYVIQKRKHLLSKRILGYCETFNELNLAEKTCIEFYQSNDKKYGYNITDGGQGITGLFGELNPAFGKKDHAHGLVKYGKQCKGKTIESIYGKKKAEEIRKKISKANKNKKRSDQAKENYRKANLGSKNPLYKKISMSAINKVLNIYKNTQYANDISRKLNLNLYDVKKILKENNLKFYIRPQNDLVSGEKNGRFVFITIKQQNKILNFYKSGYTITQISEKMNFSIFKIKQILQQNNIQIQHSRIPK